MQNPPKLGFFIQPVHPPTRPYADVLREDREAVVLADRLGYREAFIGEHLASFDAFGAIRAHAGVVASGPFCFWRSQLNASLADLRRSFRHSQQHCASCHKMIAGDFRRRV